MDADLYTRMAANAGEHWWFAARRRILKRLLAGLPLPESPRILEAGCGTGANLPMLSAFGRVSAFESDAIALAHASRVPGATVRQGRLPDCLPEFADREFDLICAWDVLEHVEDDTAALASLHRVLAPGGFLVVTAPAYAWLYSRHDESHHHFRRYVRQDLVAKSRAAGFSALRSGYFNCVLFPVLALTRLWERLSKARQASGTELPPAPVNTVLYALFSLEALVIGRSFFPFGASVIAVLQRD